MRPDEFIRKHRAIYWTGTILVGVLCAFAGVAHAQRQAPLRPAGRFIVLSQQTMNAGEAFVVLDASTGQCHAVINAGGTATGVIQGVPCE